MPGQVIAQSKFLDERDRGPIGPEQVVIEALEPDARLDLETRRQSAGNLSLFEDGDLVSSLDEPQGSR
jgi:hypothetical protein